MELQLLDWIVIGAYLAILATIGLFAMFRVKSTSQYFLGERRFGKLLMVGQSFGVSTHAEMVVSLAGAVYSIGISAIWYQWKNLFAMPFYWTMAPVFRRFRRATSAEVMEDRYGRRMADLYTLFAFLFFIIALASVLKGGAKILCEVLGGRLSVNRLVVALAVILVVYSFMGGLLASAWSNFIQGLLIILLSVMLIPLGWRLVGGFTGMKQNLPAAFFSMATPKHVSAWFIAMLTVNGLIGIMAQPQMIAAVGTGKDEYTCQVGFLHGTVVKRLCTICWAIVGLMAATMVARALFGTKALSDPEEAFGFACRHLLTTGVRGLLFASVIGATLACCSALMIDSGALLTRGFYASRLSPGRSDRHYLWVGRLTGMAAVFIAVVYAVLLIQKVLYSFLLMETMATYMGISFVTGIVWPRANRWGAASSLIIAVAVNFSLYHLTNERLDYWDPNIFLCSLLMGTLGLIVVSLLTPPEDATQLAKFFRNLETPSDSAWEVKPAGAVAAVVGRELSPRASSPPAEPGQGVAESGRQLIIVNLLHLSRGAHGYSLFRAYRNDLKGVAMGSALCAALVLCLWLTLQL